MSQCRQAPLGMICLYGKVMAMAIKLALLGNELEARAAPAATAILRSHPLSDKKVADKGKGSSELRASFGEEGGRQSSLVNEVYRFPSPLVDIVIFVFAGGGGGGGEKEMNDFLSLPPRRSRTADFRRSFAWLQAAGRGAGRRGRDVRFLPCPNERKKGKCSEEIKIFS